MAVAAVVEMAGEVVHTTFDQPGAGFVLLRAGVKFPPIEEGWQKPENAHTFQEATIHATKGGNVGAIAGNGHIGLDQDDPTAFEGAELPATTTWETRPGRLGMRFTCKDRTTAVLGKYGKKADQAQIKLYKNGEQVGEVKLERTYQVIPPSWKTLENGQRADYKLLHDVPPTEISLDWLLSELQRIGITFSEKGRANATKLEGFKRDATNRKLDRTRKAREFTLEAAQKALRGNRNDVGFWLACQLRDLGLDAGKASEHMREYARSAPAGDHPYTEEEAQTSLRQAYSYEQREPPKRQSTVEGQADVIANPELASPCDIQELMSTFKKWLHIQEDYNVTALFTASVANFCEGSPDIVGIIGPSGSNKTELIRALGETQNEYVYPVSTITEHTLVSGHKDSRDLVPQLKGRILAIKDLTSILARKEDVRAAIFADFRELTDEYIRKEFGNGISKEYRGIHSSILFASTNAIERYYSMYSNLGQRMIFIRPRNDPKKARERAFQNRGKQKEMREELHATTKRFIASMIRAKDEKGLPSTPEDIQDEMGPLYDFLAMSRTTIHHDYRTGEIDELPEPEFPTRIANTIGRLCEVHALFYGREDVSDEDIAFGCRIIADNIPSMRWKVLNVLTTEWQTTPIIAKSADLPAGAAKYPLDELVALKLVEKFPREEKDRSMDRRTDSYKLSSEALESIEKLKTRIRGGCNTDSKQSKLINNQNISLSNPCPLFSHVDGEEGTSQKNGLSSELHQAEVEARKKEEHFKQVADEHQGDSPPPESRDCGNCSFARTLEGSPPCQPCYFKRGVEA